MLGLKEKKTRTEEELQEYIVSSLHTLDANCKLYDQGHYLVSRDIATIVYRLVTDELVKAKPQGRLSFLSHRLNSNPRNLVEQALVSVHDVQMTYDGKSPPTFTVTHVPYCHTVLLSETSSKYLKFKDWWNEPVLIAGASDDGWVPLRDTDQVPFSKRRRITRHLFTKTLRNKAGAHLDREYDTFIEDKILRPFQTGITIGSVNYILGEPPEKTHYLNNRAHAVVRHIAQEIIESSKNWKFSNCS